MSQPKTTITGVVHKNFKNGWTHTEIRNRGYLMVKYRYPTIERKFSSKLISYDNLHLCGGWSLDGIKYKDQCIMRVMKGLKPFGVEIYDTHEEVDKIEKIIKKHIKNDNFKYTIVEREMCGKIYIDVTVASTKRFDKLFKIYGIFDRSGKIVDSLENSLMRCYDEYLFRKVPKNIYNDVIFCLEQLEGKKVSDYLGFDYANPYSVEDLVITGLILGYPIETTASLIIRDFGI